MLLLKQLEVFKQLKKNSILAAAILKLRSTHFSHIELYQEKRNLYEIFLYEPANSYQNKFVFLLSLICLKA